MYPYTYAYISAGQRRAAELSTNVVHEPPRGCWGLSPGPLKEQPVLVISYSSPRPFLILFHGNECSAPHACLVPMEVISEGCPGLGVRVGCMPLCGVLGIQPTFSCVNHWAIFPVHSWTFYLKLFLCPYQILVLYPDMPIKILLSTGKLYGLLWRCWCVLTPDLIYSSYFLLYKIKENVYLNFIRWHVFLIINWA